MSESKTPAQQLLDLLDNARTSKGVTTIQIKPWARNAFYGILEAFDPMYEALKAQEALTAHTDECPNCSPSWPCDTAMTLRGEAALKYRAALSKAKGE